jgi:DNA-binding CsgD family transcriptional regulator
MNFAPEMTRFSELFCASPERYRFKFGSKWTILGGMPKVHDLALSQRQLDCLRKAAEHKDSAVIAFELGISKHTVDNHIAAAVRKLGVFSRRQAIQLVLAHDRDAGASHSITSDFSPVDVRNQSGSLADLPEALSGERRDRGEARDDRYALLDRPSAGQPSGRMFLPLRPKDGADNSFTAGQTLILIVVTAAVLLIGAAALLNGLVGLRGLH